MNRISKQLLKIAREINATQYDDFARLAQGFVKDTKQQCYDILQIAVDKLKSIRTVVATWTNAAIFKTVFTDEIVKRNAILNIQHFHKTMKF